MVKEAKKPTINLTVPTDMKEWIEDKATAQDINASIVVRAIIRKAMNEEKGA